MAAILDAHCIIKIINASVYARASNKDHVYVRQPVT